MGDTPFVLVYGSHAVLSNKTRISTIRSMIDHKWIAETQALDRDTIKERREAPLMQIEAYQQTLTQ